MIYATREAASAVRRTKKLGVTEPHPGDDLKTLEWRMNRVGTLLQPATWKAKRRAALYAAIEARTHLNEGRHPMTYSTIYSLGGAVITDGVQTQAICDATINTARALAAHRRCSVIVEDRGTEECYRVTPAGHKWRAPAWWGAPSWGQEP